MFVLESLRMFTSTMRANEQVSTYPEVGVIVRTLVIFQLPLAFCISPHRFTSIILFSVHIRVNVHFARHPSAHGVGSDFNRVTSCRVNAYVVDAFLSQKKRDEIRS